jgi:hypothetical protein
VKKRFSFSVFLVTTAVALLFLGVSLVGRAQGPIKDIAVARPLAVDPHTIGVTTVWEVTCDQPDALFGDSVGQAGDVNGDGFSDVFVGAPSFNTQQWNVGRVFVYHGSATSVSANPNWFVDGEYAGAYIGTAVAGAGDVNGDGYSDLIIGDPRYERGQLGEGRANVYYGSASGLTINPNWSIESNQDYAQFGHSVAVGDVNGDGYSDVIIGAPRWGCQEPEPDLCQGAAYVYYGSASGPSDTPNWFVVGNPQDSDLGYYAVAGDVNGDGYSDVVIGAPNSRAIEGKQARFYIYYGSATGLSTTADETALWSRVIALKMAGDVNGDGYDDLIAGLRWACAINFVPNPDEMHCSSGARVHHGSAVGPSAIPNWEQLWTLYCDMPCPDGINPTGFGQTLATAGDVNRDGYTDIVIGSYSEVFVYCGSASGLSTNSNFQVPGNVGATAGDVNRDGYSDLIVGGGGWVRIYSFAPPPPPPLTPDKIMSVITPLLFDSKPKTVKVRAVNTGIYLLLLPLEQANPP